MGDYTVDSEADRVGQAFIGALQLAEPVNKLILQKVVRLSKERLAGNWPPEEEADLEQAAEASSPRLPEEAEMDWSDIEQVPRVVT